MINNSGTVRTRGNAILWALLINVLIVLVCFVIFTPAFETNDDTGLISIASGIRGTRDPHIVHTNYLIGKLLTSLYAINPGLQWWSLLQFLFLFIAFFLITLMFVRNTAGIAGVLFTAAVVFFFSYEGYVRIQYTKTAGILCAAGLMLLFYGLLQKKPGKMYIIAGTVLTVLGSFYRVQSFACITVIFLAMVIYGLMFFGAETEDPKKRIIAAVAAGAILLILAGGFRVYDRSQYRDPEWAAYLEFDKYRTEVLDYGVPDYEKHEAEYNAAGIDSTAYKLMKRWTFQDNEKFTADTFKQIASFREKKTLNTSLVKSFIKSFAKGALKEGTFLCALAAAACWLLTGRHRLRNFLSLLVMCAMIGALEFYLYYAGRFMFNRVDVGIWLAAVLIIMYQTIIDKPERQSDASDGKARALSVFRTVVTSVLILAMAGMFLFAEPWQSGLRSAAAETAADAAAERDTIERVSSDKDHLYLTKVGTLRFSAAYGVTDPMPYKIADNIFPLGGWGSATPAYTSVLKKYGVNNPFRDMIGNERIYLVDDRIDDTLAYLRKWYKADAEAELVNTINGQNIYRIK